jgi:hypothetical protein
MSKLHFELYAHGDPYLKAEINDNGDGYHIEQADKFEVRYFEEICLNTTHLGYYDTIYEALDAANNHYENKLAEEGSGALLKKSNINPSSTVEKSYQKEFVGCKVKYPIDFSTP